MKKLIVSGDSCTEKEFDSPAHPDKDFDYPKWPEHVGKQLNMEVINLARGGSGNSFIYSSLQDAIMQIPNDEIGLVIAGWTQSHRKDWEEGRLEHWRPGFKEPTFTMSPWRSTRVDKDGDLIHFVRKSLRTYIAFQNLCENNNIPYFHFQMGDIFENMLHGLKPTEAEIARGKPRDSREKYRGSKSPDLRKILDLLTQYTPHIKNFMGWPGVTNTLRTYVRGVEQYDWPLLNVDGYTMHDNILGANFTEMMKKGLIISWQDDHPNEDGHREIANFIVENIKYPNYKY